MVYYMYELNIKNILEKHFQSYSSLFAFENTIKFNVTFNSFGWQRIWRKGLSNIEQPIHIIKNLSNHTEIHFHLLTLCRFGWLLSQPAFDMATWFDMYTEHPKVLNIFFITFEFRYNFVRVYLIP